MDKLTFFYEIVTKSELKRKKYFMGQNSITLNSIMYHLSQNVSI